MTDYRPIISYYDRLPSDYDQLPSDYLRLLPIIRACIFMWFSDPKYVIFMWSKKAKYVVKNAKYVISKTQKVAF